MFIIIYRRFFFFCSSGNESGTSEELPSTVLDPMFVVRCWNRIKGHILEEALSGERVCLKCVSSVTRHHDVSCTYHIRLVVHIFLAARQSRSSFFFPYPSAPLLDTHPTPAAQTGDRG